MRALSLLTPSSRLINTFETELVAFLWLADELARDPGAAESFCFISNPLYHSLVLNKFTYSVLNTNHSTETKFIYLKLFVFFYYN